MTPAPTLFQAIMKQVLHAFILADKARVYLDNIIVVGASREEVIANTSAILRALFAKNFRISFDKLQVAVPEVSFHLVRHGEVRVDPGRTAAITSLPFPSTRKELRSWLGMASFLRIFIPNFAALAAPLSEEAA